MTIPTPEQTAAWTDADYFAFDAVNASSLKQLAKNPLMYKHRLLNPIPKTSSMVLGSAVHCLVFEPLEFEKRYAVTALNKRTKLYKEWAAEQGDKDILTEAEHDKALQTALCVSEHPMMSELLAHPGTQVERAIVWQGLFGPCKAKIDLLHYSDEHGLIIIDLKTTSGDLDEHTLTHTMGRYLVHLQLYHYRHAACALLDLPYYAVEKMRLGALYVQTSAPHDTVLCELSPNTIMASADLYKDLADLYEGCKTMGLWPGYDKVRTVDIPDYYTTIKK